MITFEAPVICEHFILIPIKKIPIDLTILSGSPPYRRQTLARLNRTMVETGCRPQAPLWIFAVSVPSAQEESLVGTSINTSPVREGEMAKVKWNFSYEMAQN